MRGYPQKILVWYLKKIRFGGKKYWGRNKSVQIERERAFFNRRD